MGDGLLGLLQSSPVIGPLSEAATSSAGVALYDFGRSDLLGYGEPNNPFIFTRDNPFYKDEE